MTSFATHRLRVHDTASPPYRRLSALRTCLTEFAPYGLRATYHHLCRSAGIPEDLERDAGALVRAVEELEAAREIWRADFAAWQARRWAQKAAGVRTPNPPEPRRRLYCPDPEFHPTEPLPVVMRRILRTPPGDLTRCPVCPEDRGLTSEGLCAGCGGLLTRPHRPAAEDDLVAAAREDRWKLVWKRRV